MIEGCGTLFVFKLNANKKKHTTSVVMRKTFSKEKYVYKKINRKDFQV